MKIQSVWDNQGKLIDLGFLYSDTSIYFEIQNPYNPELVRKYYKFYVGERSYRFLDIELKLFHLEIS